MWKEAVVAKLEVLHRHFHGKAEEKHEIHQPEIGGLMAGILYPKFSNTKQKCCPLHRDVR